MKRLPAIATALVLCFLPASGSTEPLAARVDIDRVVQAYMDASHAPGVSLAVVAGGALAYARSYGRADVENGVPAELETRFRIASVSKPITAVAVLQLAERGAIDLDLSIRRYVPAYPHDVSVRDLLRHTGGVRHFRTRAELTSTRRCERLSEGLEAFARDPLEHPPGTGITYSSFGYVLLGMAVEAASGEPYATYVRRHVLAPAGMSATVPDDLREIIPHRSRGYALSTHHELRNADLMDSSCRLPAGGFLSTARDLAAFALALRGGRLLRPASLAQMTRSQIAPETANRVIAEMRAKLGPGAVPPGYRPPGLGYGWAIGTQTRPDAVWHGGNQPGATAMLYMLPKDGLAVAILTNLEGKGDELTALAEQVARLSAADRTPAR